MRSKSLLAAVLATVLSTGVTVSSAWADKGGKGKAKSGEAMPDNISKQFQWEEKVVGPNDKKIDHAKIARMQEEARKEEARHKDEPTVKKQERAKGVSAPANSTLPTMDIEKPSAPVAAAPKPRAKPVAETRQRDSLDNLLDSEKDTGGTAKRGSGSSGLDKVLAVDDKPAASRGSSKSAKSKRAKGRP